MKIEPSVAKAPDLDWSQVRETVRMMELAAAQVNMALREGDDSVGSLSNSFTSMITNVGTIAAAVTEMDAADQTSPVAKTIMSNCEQVSEQMQAAIMAFQFYDKLSQRLAHVIHSLDCMGGLIADQERLYNPCEWHGLQKKIRARYSMREEQEMFDALLNGASVEEALKLGEEKIADRATDDDIELF